MTDAEAGYRTECANDHPGTERVGDLEGRDRHEFAAEDRACNPFVALVSLVA